MLSVISTQPEVMTFTSVNITEIATWLFTVLSSDEKQPLHVWDGKIAARVQGLFLR